MTAADKALERPGRMAKPLRAIGEGALHAFAELGRVLLFFGAVMRRMVRRPLRLTLWLQQAEFVGVGSLFIVFLTGGFTGAVFTLQTVHGLEQVNMESMVGVTMLLAVTRELAPVLTALMVTGRVGSAMATELGTMRVTEQIDAMEVMAVDPLHYLVVPRVVASALMVPVLCSLFVLVAVLGSYVVAIPVLGIDEGAYAARMWLFVDPFDIRHGIIKAIVFGVVLAVVGCYKGYNASGGARGVGMATTQAVVIGSISIFVLDYLLTSGLMQIEPTWDSVPG